MANCVRCARVQAMSVWYILAASAAAFAVQLVLGPKRDLGLLAALTNIVILGVGGAVYFLGLALVDPIRPGVFLACIALTAVAVCLLLRLLAWLRLRLRVRVGE